MEYLAAHGWRTYAMNPRGYYKSRWDNVAALTVEDYLADIQNVRQALGLNQVIMAGYSMGGLLAIKHAERHGADALILYDSDASKEIWQAIGRKPHSAYVPPVVRFWPSHNIVQEMCGGRVSRKRYLEFLELFKQTVVSGRSFCITEYGGLDVDTNAITCPVLLIGIRRDERVQAEWFQRLKSTWLVFEGNSHGSILVGRRSQTITEEMARWLDHDGAGHSYGVGRKKIFPVLGFVSRDASAVRMRLFYFSAWTQPEIEIRPPGRRPAIRIRMERVGRGREDGESLHEAIFTLDRRNGFFLREGRDADRPPGGGLYRPLAREIHLADGEFFSDRDRAVLPRRPAAYRDMKIYFQDLRHHFRVHVMIPRNYTGDGAPYPVCILNDGQNQWKNHGAYGGWHTDVITAGLCRKGRCRDVFLVSVESTQINRNKYFLTPPVGRGDLYVNFLADVLMPALRKEYNLSYQPHDIGIVGASYGANNAVYAGVKRPDVFGLIGSLSYAPLKGRPLMTWMQNLPHLPFKKLYADCGTRWAPHQRGNRTDNTRTTIDLIRMAQSKGMIPGRTIRGLVAKGHCHNEICWRKRIGGCMEFLFSLVY